MRITGVTIPNEKKIGISLRYIFGIGPTLSGKILRKAGVDENIRTKNLTSEQEDKIRLVLEKEYKVEGDLRKEVRENIARLKRIGSYRGMRHIMGLPSRGQRTRVNARTKRGKRKTIGAMKKEDAAKLETSK